jgi:hypothetical protein
MVMVVFSLADRSIGNVQAGQRADGLPTTPFAPRVAGTLRSHFNQGVAVRSIAANVLVSDAAAKGIVWSLPTITGTRRNDATVDRWTI